MSKIILRNILLSILLFVIIVGCGSQAIEDKLSDTNISKTNTSNTSPPSTPLANSIGTDYYVSNSGADDNNGTSEASAWKSIDKVNQEIIKDRFVSGDNILFKRGDIWRENNNGRMLYIKDVTPDTDASSPIKATYPITFGAYGVGTNPEFKADVEIIRITKSSNITFKDLRLLGDNKSGTIGVSMYFDYSQSGEDTDRSPTTHNNYITFDNIYIDGMHKGMVLAGKYLTLKNSTIRNTHGSSQQNGVWINSGSDNFVAENNLFDDNGNFTHGHSIYFASGKNGVIKNNIFRDTDQSTVGGAVFQFHSETWYSPIQNWTIIGNTFEDNPSMAIQLQPECCGNGEPYKQIISDINIEQNIFKNNKYVMQIEGNKNVTFQNNIVIGNRSYVSFYISDEWTNKVVENLLIQNNTFYNNNNNRVISWGDKGGDFIFQNNIVYEEDLARGIIYKDQNPTTETYRNNIYYIPKYLTTINESGSIDYGVTPPSPLFVNTGTDFHLIDNSVAIDKGFINALSIDYDNKTRVNTPDIGAFEFSK